MEEMSDEGRTRRSHLHRPEGDTLRGIRVSELFGRQGIRVSGRVHTVLWCCGGYHVDTRDAGLWRRSMNVLVSGAKGLIGSSLVPELEAGGPRVNRLTDRKS